ncbi:MAG: peptidoglycan DD-metalloendopeptidase family protein [Anaerolineaceae bacterium]|nr:peptidoglycan DD-metalloendopeptidase family protein [Anaerolineaceae bacterium]
MSRKFIQVLVVFLILGIAGCQVEQSPGNSPTPSFSQTEKSSSTPPMQTTTNTLISPTITETNVLYTKTPQSTYTKTATLKPSASPTIDYQSPSECNQEESWCVFPVYFPLSNPISIENNQNPDISYRYGSTGYRTRETHHGIELSNPAGTPVLSAAEGIVKYAGNDATILFGLYNNFYGNLIIIEHDLPGYKEKVYTLYAHLSKILVKTDDYIQAGKQIGEVGLSGSAIGSHLHFEVRSSLNDYKYTSNPEIWLEPGVEPLSGEQYGVLGVNITQNGKAITSQEVTLEYYEEGHQDFGKKAFAETYAWNTPLATIWNENLIVGNLQAGRYRVTFSWNNSPYIFFTEVFPGSLTIQNINIK